MNKIQRRVIVMLVCFLMCVNKLHLLSVVKKTKLCKIILSRFEFEPLRIARKSQGSDLTL